MISKPTTAVGYTNDAVQLVRATCLYVATKLGDLMDDLVVIGGLAPSLLVDQEHLRDGVEAHVGTMDLDIGMTVALLDEGRYQELTQRLRNGGFEPDENEDGNPTRQRWKIEKRQKVTLDFLIAPSLPGDRGGSIRNIEQDFAAIIAPGLHLAFRDRVQVSLHGQTISGEDARREIWVCGAGAFLVLKALAFKYRGENKDAYDLFYVLRNYGAGVHDVLERLRPLLEDDSTAEALDVLRNDFCESNGIGPRRVAEFLGGPNEDLEADVVGYVQQLLDGCG